VVGRVFLTIPLVGYPAVLLLETTGSFINMVSLVLSLLSLIYVYYIAKEVVFILKNIGLKSIFSSSIARKLLLALTTISIALLSISCFYFAESYRVEPVTIYKNTYKLAQVNTSILYNVSVKPSMIYDYAAVVNYPMIYLSLVQKIQYLFDIAWIIYNDTYSGVASSINYTVTPAMAINTPSLEQEIPAKSLCS